MRRIQHNGGEVMIQTWIQTLVNILAMVGSVFWIYNQLDRRLTVLETKMEASAKTQTVYAMHYEVADLQRQIDEMRAARFTGGKR